MQKNFRPSQQDIELLKVKVALGHENAVSNADKERWGDILAQVKKLVRLADKNKNTVPTPEMRCLYHQALQDIALMSQRM